jgi:riboflavin-specific deaminase-like protein
MQPLSPPDETTAPHDRRAWRTVLAAAVWARSQADATGAPSSFSLSASGTLVATPSIDCSAWLEWTPGRGWRATSHAPEAARALLELYLPICSASPGRPLAVAHLGQSLDGYIATADGDSYYVTGPENVLHLHRMRALCGAVVVGAETIARDDPRLTVRHVEGPSPLRVIIDPRRRLSAGHRVFAGDEAPTLLVCEQASAGSRTTTGSAEILELPSRDDELDLALLLRRLHERGIHAVFIEGGGATVSAFLEAGLLDRLQVAVAPLLIGNGRQGIRMSAHETISECLRPAHRVFAMGGDVLFDCDLRETYVPPRARRAGDISRVI